MVLTDTFRSELGEDATRFDLLAAATSPHNQFIVWVTWSAVSGIAGIFTLTFFLSILSSPKARGRSFNVYVLFITFPDMFFSIACSVTCGLNAAIGQYYSERMCAFQTFYTIFAFASNAWLNAVIVRQVHTMLRSSYQRRRYRPPTIKAVCGHAAIVYCYAALIASMTLWGTLHRHTDARGLACLPLEHDVRSSLFFWLCYFWLLIGIPLVYVTYVLFDVKRRRLLPPGGRTRSVAVFFARITFVFLLMWLPTMVLIYMANRVTGVWLLIGGLWSHLQPIVSASVACMKGDIKEAVYNFLICRWCNAEGRRDTMVNSGDDDDDEEDDGDEPRTNASNTSKRSKRARRSSVFNSFLSWKVTRPGSMANVRDAVTPRKVPVPPISSSGGITSEEGARSSVVDEDIFIDDEDATVEKDDGKKEGGGSTGDINV